MGVFARAAARVSRAFEKRPSGAVHATTQAIPLATRTWRELTPDEALAALEAAQSGSIRAACDFCDALLTDDRVGGVLDTRTLGMLGLPVYFEGADLAEWYALAPEGELASLLKWGLFLGAGFARILANGSLEAWHPRNFDFDRVTGQWYVTTGEGRELVNLCSGEWVIYQPYGKRDSVLAGLWCSLILPVMVKLFSLHDRARASEVFGSAMIVGKAPEGSTEDQRSKWLTDLKALARSSRLVLPDSYDLKLLEPQGQTWGIYQNSIEWADTAITIRLAGQIVTTEGQKGFARGDVHASIARSLLRFGEATFSTCLAQSYIPYVWGTSSIVRWQTASPDDLIGEGSALKALAEGITAISATLASEAVELDLPAYLRRFGVSTRTRAIEATPKVQLTFAPATLEKFIRVDEGRVSQGLPPLGGDEGNQFIVALGLPAAPAPAPAVLRVAASAKLPTLRGICAATAIPKEPAKEFRIFKFGANKTDYGTRFYTAESARLIMRAAGNRGVMIDLEHHSLDKESAAYDPDARGWCRLQARADGLWAINVRWTADGMARIRSRRQRGISPVFTYRAKDSVITAIHNLALTAMPATHDGVILIAASKGHGMQTLREMLGLPPEATIADILAALGLEASASAEDTLNAVATALESSDGEGDGGTEGDAAGANEGDDKEAKDAAAKVAKEAASKKLAVKPATARPALPQAESRRALDVHADRLSALEKRDEDRERATLIASRSFKPWEKTMLASADIATVRTYAANAKPAPEKTPGVDAADSETAIASTSLDAIAKATGLTRETVAAAAKKGM